MIMHQDQTNDLKMLPLNNTLLCRRIDKMNDDIENQLHYFPM